MGWISLILATYVFSADAAFTGNKCVTFSSGNVQSLCPGRTLPRDRLRNFSRSSHRMECSANADRFIRRPQRYDFLRWSDLRGAGQKEQAFELRRSLPDVRWTGEIPYQTTEVWSWQECELGTDSYHCGTTEHCHDEHEEQCDSKGEHCHQVSRRVCYDEANSCYYDQDRSEALACSKESLGYEANYARPDPAAWNLHSDAYAEFIPNKYDLMPGELEVIETFTNHSRSERLNPYVVVGDAWNKYDFKITGSGAGAACRPFTRYNINVEILTLKRDTTKASPNAFELPEDENGKPIDPIYNWVGDAKVTKGQPANVMLDDHSAAVVRSLAEHSQDNAERINAEAAAGKISNPDGMGTKEAMEDGFFKNTVVRVQLVKKNHYWMDRRLGWNIYNDDVKSVQASNNVLSENQEIFLADKWDLDFLHSKTRFDKRAKKVDLYWNERFHLRPDRVYVLKISMYQRGVPFYRQDCELAPRFGCTWPWPIGRSENAYFSKPLEIRFETSKDWKRATWADFFYDGDIGPVNVLRHLFEPFVAEKTKGENP